MNGMVRPLALRALVWMLVALVLVAGFLSYLRPGFLLDMGTRIITCF